MIKFLSAVIFLALSYLSMTIVSKYDTTLTMLFYDYKVEISLFLLIVFFIFTLCLSSIGFRIIGMVFKLPYLIAAKLAGYRKSNHIKLLLDAYSNMIMGNNDATQKIVGKLDMKSGYPEFDDHIHLLKALTNTDSERNMYLMHSLLSNKQFHDFAVQKIASRMYDSGFYEQSLGFVEHSKLDLMSNKEGLYLMILLYAQLNIWESFVVYMAKYQSFLKTADDKHMKEIARLYLRGAKYYLSLGEEEEAMVFLENALEYDPVYMEAIEIFCRLNISRQQQYKNITIIESAFTASPSFELFELYNKSSNLSPPDIYEKFYRLVDASYYLDVFLSIAAYLKLFDKVDTLIAIETKSRNDA